MTMETEPFEDISYKKWWFSVAMLVLVGNLSVSKPKTTGCKRLQDRDAPKKAEATIRFKNLIPEFWWFSKENMVEEKT